MRFGDDEELYEELENIYALVNPSCINDVVEVKDDW